MNQLYIEYINIYLAFEILGFISFAAILAREIYHRNTERIYEILSCFVFGMILEIGNTYLAHTYSYSPEFLVNIFHVPVAIGMGWAAIIYCAMLLSDQYNIPWTLRPFMDALTAVILDLSLDAIAIRLDFWHWAIPLNEEWYGVPFENLVGWILVVLSFSFIVRYLRTLNIKRTITKILYILSPFLSYIGLTIGLIIFSLLVIMPFKINSWNTLLFFNYKLDFNLLYNPQVQLWKTIFLVILFVELVNIVIWSIVKYHKNFLRQFDLLSFIILSLMHLFFFFALFETGMYSEIPILIFISAGMFLVHCLMHFLPYLLNPRVVYIFRGAQKTFKMGQGKVEEIVEKMTN